MTKPYLLALDTAHQVCSVALVNSQTQTTFYRNETVGNRHAERILTMIDELLAEAGITKADVGAIAFGQGPGSFTGLRVACGVAQGLAWGLAVPLVQINNLLATAQALREAGAVKTGDIVAIVNDARMEEIYARIYRVTAEGERLEAITDNVLIKPAMLEAWLAEYAVTHVAGSALAAYGLTPAATVLASPETMIVALARLALAPTPEEAVSPANAHPVYVRDRVALTIEERAHGERL